LPTNDLVASGLGRTSLEAMLAHAGAGSIDAAARYDALARYEELPIANAIRSGRGWKHDLAKLDFQTIVPFETAQAVELDVEALLPQGRRNGVTIERFSLARERHRIAFEDAFGRAVDTRDDKFASLALAFQNHGAFVDVPAGVIVDEPLVIGYEARASALFPYTLVSMGNGARATIVERLAAVAGAPLVCGITELVLGDRAELTYAVEQRAPQGTRLIMTRRASLGTDARLEFATAELGGTHAVSRFRAYESSRGAQLTTVVLFFSDGDQHVDVETESVHSASDTMSRTIVRSAGNGRGQGRYLGNIKILADGHGTDASLRDDALLLSKGAHIDSIPALEIAANDVKAYHGATVGAISEDELFYAQTRGISREEAERMIALGFFEPAVEHFPRSIRDEIRAALERKIGTATVAVV
jgi:Fe-S cluster assembly protein SufD